MIKYSPKIDIVFRKLFGSEKNTRILLSLVNAILETESKICKLTIKNPYNVADYIASETSILDIKAEDENGVMYNIEMQVSELGMYGKRALYYLSKVFTDQIGKGEDYSLLNKTIGIHFLDFIYFADDRHVRHLVMKDSYTNEVYEKLNYQELYFIEMIKFKKDFTELHTLLDNWITFLNNAQKLSKDHIPEEIKKNNEIIEALELLDNMYFDEKEIVLYEAEKKRRMDSREEMRTVMEKGVIKGKLEVAANLLDVLDDETISLKTGLNIEEIKSLRK